MAKVKRFNKQTGKEEIVEQTPEEIETSKSQKEAGRLFVQAREKAINKGADKREAVAIAEEQTRGVSTKPVTLERAKEAALILANPDEVKRLTNESLGIQAGEIKGSETERDKAAQEFISKRFEGQDISKVSGLEKGVAGTRFAAQETIKEVITLGFAAKIIDQIRIGITGKKPLGVQQAEGSLTEAMTDLNTDMEKVKAGANPRDMKTNLVLAENALARLESSQKGIGQNNLRYWSDEGAEVETTISIARNNLDDLRKELLLLTGF